MIFGCPWSFFGRGVCFLDAQGRLTDGGACFFGCPESFLGRGEVSVGCPRSLKKPGVVFGTGEKIFGCTYTLICVIQVTCSDYLTRVLAKIKNISIRVVYMGEGRTAARVYFIPWEGHRASFSEPHLVGRPRGFFSETECLCIFFFKNCPK